MIKIKGLSFSKVEIRNILDQAEKQGIISDTMEVRLSLVKKLNNGEITADQLKKELKQIVKDGKKNGLLSRDAYLKSVKRVRA